MRPAPVLAPPACPLGPEEGPAGTELTSGKRWPGAELGPHGDQRTCSLCLRTCSCSEGPLPPWSLQPGPCAGPGGLAPWMGLWPPPWTLPCWRPFRGGRCLSPVRTHPGQTFFRKWIFLTFSPAGETGGSAHTQLCLFWALTFAHFAHEP